MKAKKNPKFDLNRNRGLYFSIGLTIVLFITWRAIESKSYQKVEKTTYQLVNIDHDLPEDIPITQSINLPPAPPPVLPEYIEIVENEQDIVETLIESSESDQEMEIKELEIIATNQVNVEEEEEDVFVPFVAVEEPPIFPGCEGLSKADGMKCFNKKIQEHIKTHLKYPIIAQEMGIQGRVYVTFVIDKNGYVTNIQKRGPDKNLEKEAVRIINTLPRMTPGRQRQLFVNVPYSIPINFVFIEGGV